MIGEGSNCLDTLERVAQSPHRCFRRLLGLQVSTPEQANSKTLASRSFRPGIHAEKWLQDVNVDVQVYDPKLQWARLQANPVLLPFGNTLAVRYRCWAIRYYLDAYSITTITMFLLIRFPSIPKTKDWHCSKQPCQIIPSSPLQGTYAMLQYAPIAPVVHQVETTSDLLTYTRIHQRAELEHDLYQSSMVISGHYTLSEATWFLPGKGFTPIVTDIAATTIGGVVGAGAGYTYALWDERNANRLASLENGRFFGSRRTQPSSSSSTR